MTSRRVFLGRILGGTATLAVSGTLPSRRILGANDRVRVGLIGAGGRGQGILKAAMRCPNTEAVAVTDVYTRRLDETKQFAPHIRAFADFRRLLDDSSLDAVLIASPQHQHALHFVPAIQAGKDIYQEKTMAFNPDHARRMRRAFEGSGRVVQIGIQSLSGPTVAPSIEHTRPERIGTITGIHTHHYRNAPYGGWRRAIPHDCDAQHVDWKEFEGEASPHPFDPNRYMNWRFFWDYSGGNVFENMVHQVGFWYKLLDLKIPRAVAMSGGTYLSPGMEVPDTMDVSMDQPENILFTWNSGFGNRFYGEGADTVLGNRGTVLRNGETDEVRFVPEGSESGRNAGGDAQKSSDKAPDLVDASDDTDVHMQDFINCVRSRKQPACPFEIGYRSAIACQMAITSYRQGRTVRWDAQHEEIV
ncbi:MAG: Gfo/Idh/MocA family oxidoreductase [Acidobacteria bacterium]|nr:Gfo/Idh/MocA family oxidoreductase [Acidobacteriota bacterium]